jgi:hypothetical protein
MNNWISVQGHMMLYMKQFVIKITKTIAYFQKSNLEH